MPAAALLCAFVVVDPPCTAGGVGLLEVLLQREIALRDLEKAVCGDPLVPPGKRLRQYVPA